MYIKINSINYELIWVGVDKIPGSYGECNKVDKTIKIAKTKNRQTALKTLAHELTHALIEETALKHSTFKENDQLEEAICEISGSIAIIIEENFENIEHFLTGGI